MLNDGDARLRDAQESALADSPADEASGGGCSAGDDGTRVMTSRAVRFAIFYLHQGDKTPGTRFIVCLPSHTL